MIDFTPKDPDYRSRVVEDFAKQNLMNTIGAELALIEPGRAEIVMAKRDDLCQQHGFLHAGITTTLADTAAGYAAFSLMPKGAEVLSTEFKINLLNPAEGKRFSARAEVLKPGRTLTVVRSDVWAEDETGRWTMIASMLATMICLMPK
ncbi:PaaI family thioesterase [Magnetospirillum sp. 64-120]|uniref:PaaI family thioesterase n=1 Tax=Magnetospirillum sp. 64-120 TaxID=1895778 RepID=UPI0009267E93|nr:PaaI family thioesterase [Magnetospirillum sp. 64-120]OJX70495.1 MAG: thioesterase [Magnetospirillum sp. 64-120]